MTETSWRGPDDRTLRDEVSKLLCDLIRVDTSNPPGNETPAAKLLKDYLEAAGLDCELVARTPARANLVCSLDGDGTGPSLALLGHTDVVPADEPGWTHPPFSGHIDDEGWVWGRGATDMKNETASRAVTMALLARGGFRPRGRIVFIAQADEEDGTEQVGLAWLVGARPDLRVDYSIDEGGGTRMELADGRVVVSLNVGEKATLPALVTAIGTAGHASCPTTEDNAVLNLAELVRRLGAYRTRRRLVPAVADLLGALLGDIDERDLDDAVQRACSLHPRFAESLPALLGTTIAPTRLYGSRARNVIPARASVELDCRVLPGTGPADLEEELRAALGSDLAYELGFLEPPTGGSSSPTNTPLFDAMQSFFDEHDPGAKLLPSISTGFCDSHFMRTAFGTVAYGIWPCRTTPLEVLDDTAHNVDERIHQDDLVYATRFHLHVVEALTGRG